MNKIILMGRLVRDPEIRTTSGGMAVAIITVACNRPLSKDKKQEAEAKGQPTADFIRCKTFGQRAETLERYTEKGSRIVVEGRLEIGSYKNKDGHAVNTSEIVIDNFEIIDFKENSGSYKSPKQEDEYPDGIMGPFDGSTIPF